MTDSSTDDNRSDDGTATSATEITYEIGKRELPSEAVVQATATLTNTPVIELDPLYDVVDPVHLDGLFGESNNGIVHEESSVTFSFNGCHVSVTGEAVVVREREQITR